MREYVCTMPHDIRPDLQDGVEQVPNVGGGARIYAMPCAYRPTPSALHQDSIGYTPSTDPGMVGDDREKGRVLQFPVRKRGRFDSDIRAHLGRLAAKTPAIQPLSFGHDERGVEWCLFGNGLMMSWERPGRMILTDTLSGYVDHGPFDSLDEICLTIIGLDL